jgi:hypothetical protein
MYARRVNIHLFTNEVDETVHLYFRYLIYATYRHERHFVLV